MSSLSVPDLMHSLCASLLKDSKHVNINSAEISRHKILAFEILLNKTKRSSSCQALNIDTLDELEFTKFELKLHAISAEERQKIDDSIHNFTDLFDSFKDSLNSVSTLLLLLKDSNCSKDEQYPNQFFTFPNTQKEQNNPFLPQIQPPHFISDPSLVTIESLISLRQEEVLPDDNISFFSEIFHSLTNSKKSNHKFPFKERTSQGTLSNDSLLLKEYQQFETEFLDKKRIITNKTNWEHLGHDAVFAEPPFFTENSDALFHLLKLKALKQHEEVNFIIMPSEMFISDVQHLLVGIRSDTFYYDENIVFQMNTNITVKDISKGVLQSFTDDFLECGSCFKRLSCMTVKNRFNFKLLFDGAVFKALRDCIDTFLACFRKFVLSIQPQSLLDLSRKISGMKNIVVNLARFLKIHPESISAETLPIGSEFLGYLYKELMNVSRNDLSSFYTFILKSCCDVYFSYYQKWLFEGYLEDPHKELFIFYLDLYRPNSKSFFDKAYQIRRQSVPGFLQGFEEDILLCGKYTMLLKSFKPMHPLFSFDVLPITVCLTHNDLDELKHLCINYIQMVRGVCGNNISVEQIQAKKQEKKQQAFKMAQMMAKKNLKKWKEEQAIKAVEFNKFKQKQLRDLQNQIQQIEDNKIKQRIENIELERKYLEEAEKIEHERLLQESHDRLRRIEYYEELTVTIAERKEKSDQLVKELQKQLSAEDETAKNLNPSADSVELKVKGDSMMNMSTTSDKFGLDEPNDPLNLKSIEQCKVKDDDLVMNDSFKQQLNVESSTSMSSDNIVPTKSDILNANSEYKISDSVSKSTLNFDMKPDSMNNVLKDLVEANNVSLTQLQLNKLKVLSQEFNCIKPRHDTFHEDHQKVTTEFGIFEAEPQMQIPQIIVTETLSALQQNRQRIMGHEYGTNKEVQPTAKAQETDLTRNRDRMMGQNIFETNLERMDKKLSLNFSSQTDRAKNKRIILEREFNIITGEIIDQGVSPMSLGSDLSPLKEAFISPTSPDTHRFGVPTTAQLCIATPESALIKNGFLFPDPNKENRTPVKLNLRMSTDQTDGCEDELFKDFSEAILKHQTNFFKLDLDEGFDRSFDYNEFVQKTLQMKNVDITTLTYHLQMSLTIPLNAYMEVLNQEILKVYLIDLDILAHFKSLRNYFFMMDGEFGSNICGGLLKKLEISKNPTDLLNYQTLHSLLDSAVSSSVYGNDPNADCLSFFVQSMPDNFDIHSPNVLNMLSLSYKVEWPLNLILNPETLEQYANVFKYLIKVKRISWLLDEVFQILKECHKKCGSNMLRSPQYRHVQQIRHKLSHFIHSLENHITTSALQASWKSFMDDLKGASGMESLYRKHTNYIKRILFLCLLNKKSVEFHNNIEEIFKLVLRFHKHLKSKPWTKRDDSKEYYHPKYEKLVIDEQDFEKLIKYTLYLGNKIVKHGYQQEIGDMINLLDINGYYSKARQVQLS